MRKLAGTVLAVVIAVAGVVALIAFFNARDDSTTGDSTKTTVSAPASADGNVLLTYSEESIGTRLRTLAEELGAPDTPELREAGLAVIVRQDPRAPGVVARAGEERLSVAAPDDPQLRDFIERWLGQGAAG